jgi:hypothetical protein
MVRHHIPRKKLLRWVYPKKKMSGKSRPKKMDMLDLIGGFYA